MSWERAEELHRKLIEAQKRISELTEENASLNSTLKTLREDERFYREENYKAVKYLGSGVDEARWPPGTTAIDTLIREARGDRDELTLLREVMKGFPNCADNPPSPQDLMDVLAQFKDMEIRLYGAPSEGENRPFSGDKGSN